MEAIFNFAAITAFFQVLMIDLLLAADNTIIIGLAAAGVPASQRKQVIFIGIACATVLRIAFASIITYLLAFVGLLLAGGLLLLWVAWKMWRELRTQQALTKSAQTIPPKTFREAVTQIVFADIAMSLDNVLAVAGAARDHFWVLVFGLGLSMLLMAIASHSLANFLQRNRWLAYVGLSIVLYVALRMMWDGALEIYPIKMKVL